MEHRHHQPTRSRQPTSSAVANNTGSTGISMPAVVQAQKIEKNLSGANIIQRVVDKEQQGIIIKLLGVFHIVINTEISDALAILFHAENTTLAFMNFISNLHEIVGNEMFGKEAPYGMHHYVSHVAAFYTAAQAIIGGLPEEEEEEDNAYMDEIDYDTTGNNEGKEEMPPAPAPTHAPAVMPMEQQIPDGDYTITAINEEEEEITVAGLPHPINLSEFFHIGLFRVHDVVHLTFDEENQVDDMPVVNTNAITVGHVPAGVRRELAIPLLQQSTGSSCWAAVSAAIHNYYFSNDWNEETVAAATGKSLEEGNEVATTLTAIGITATHTNNIIPFDRVMAEINAGRPIVASMSLGGTGHGTIIGGYIHDAVSPLDSSLKIFDPQFGSFYWVPYRFFALGSIRLKANVFSTAVPTNGGWMHTITTSR